jgi:pimeloyl-ACP methyl ester carboxylesterase
MTPVRPVFRSGRSVVALLTVLLSAVAATPRDGMTAAHAGPLTWIPCGRGSQCASIQVPLDWRDRHGTQINLAFAMHPANDAADRRGTLFFMPGQGVSAMEIVADRVTATNGIETPLPGWPISATGLWPKDLADHFDIVGIDQRGGGHNGTVYDWPLPIRSTPLLCSMPAHEPESYYFPTTAQGFQHLIAYNQSFAQSCTALSGRLAAYMDSETMARDVEAVRAALGVDKITWWSWTSASLVGQTYLSLFPRHVRAMVFDQPGDHSVHSGQNLVDWAWAVQDEFNRLVRYCIKQAVCSMHGQDFRRALREFVNEANAKPEASPAATGTSFTGDEMLMLIQTALQFGNLDFAGSGSNGFDAAASDFSTARDSYAAGLGEINVEPTYLFDFGWRGAWEQYRAISCGDFTSNIKTWDEFRSQVAAVRAVAPDMRGVGQAWEVFTGCLGWPYPARNPQRALRFASDEAAQVLIVGSTHSAWGPYLHTQRLASEIPNAELLTNNDDTHINYASSRCVDRHVDDFLLTLKRLGTDRSCRQEPPLAGKI